MTKSKNIFGFLKKAVCLQCLNPPRFPLEQRTRAELLFYWNTLRLLRASQTSSRCYTRVENISSLVQELDRSKEEFIKDHYLKYGKESFPPAWKALELASFGNLTKFYFNFPTFRLYAALSCMVYWLNAIQPDNTFVKDFKTLLAAHPEVDVNAMGFPATWQNEPLWNLD